MYLCMYSARILMSGLVYSMCCIVRELVGFASSLIAVAWILAKGGIHGILCILCVFDFIKNTLYSQGFVFFSILSI